MTRVTGLLLASALTACNGTANRDIVDAPGKPSFRAPPPTNLRPAEALADYLSSTPFEQDAASPRPGRRLVPTIVDAIGLALHNNLGIQQAYLGRASERLSLAAAEGKFNPLISLRGQAKLEGGETSTTIVTTQSGQFRGVVYDDVYSRDDIVTWNTSLGPTVNWLLPTGANVRLDLLAEADDSTTREVGTSTSDDTSDAYGGNVGLSISQPLLKGAGIDVNSASIRIARLNDQQNILALRSTAEETVAQGNQATLASARLQLEAA